ncbi:PREDICTED: zinc finger CCCH domain-containing protein 20-like [Nicotiana attenuata]|uniref:Zinc finger ccch domain-containing protein 20 n=1 Tax=Nicotiana attenuata TaxID=49451 RepID=A0A1J6IB25_NICAT|nr:PREDICTED: zinc finger CCCH domain-containing protein 20-like [Nicotiana attenuata]OIT01644.1 zinc finger ccch domain-containing protein 20 [Nicotiana attenuata]
MIGGKNHHLNPTVDIPPWPYTDDQTANMHFMLSPNENSNSTLSFAEDYYSQFELENGEIELPVDMYACDNFRMFEFKVRNCARGRSHDWTECPYLHPGEKARRRDPRKYHYSGTACPDFRKGNCLKGDGCEFAHGVFECWLHPARYRTQPCKDGVSCKRRVCFFAHSADQLRVLSPNAESAFEHQSPRLCGRALQFVSSPESSSPPTESPPMSPMLSRSLGSNSVNEVIASLRQLQLNRLNSMPSAWNVQLGSPRLGSAGRPVTQPGFCSLPVTPTGNLTRPGNRCFDLWEEEPVMERVESGRDLRVKMLERLSKENPLDGLNPNLNSDAPNPDVGWVSDLIQ